MNRRLLENYNSPAGASNYRADYSRKLHRKVSDRLERRLFHRLFHRAGPLEDLVDVPCGAGRLYSLFRERAGRVVEADWSFHMLRLSREDHRNDAWGYIRCNGLNLPFKDGAFEGVVSIRLNHHFETREERLRHLEETFRVARRVVIATWFSHRSFRAWSRRVRARMGGRKREKFTLRVSEVRALAGRKGFRLVLARPLTPLALGSGHVFGLFLRGEP